MTTALTVLVWALAVAVAFLVATVIVGAVIGLVKLARGPRTPDVEPQASDVVWIPGRKR